METVNPHLGYSSLVPSGNHEGPGTSGEVRRQCFQVSLLLLRFVFMICLLVVGWSSETVAGVVVIGNESLGGTKLLDRNILGRIYTGRAVQVAGTSVQPVNMKIGDATRAVFLKETLKQSDDDYVAYWIVRRAIGRGAPPPEMNSAQEMIDFVGSTPGAIGYIDTLQFRSGVRLLLVLP